MAEPADADALAQDVRRLVRQVSALQGGVDRLVGQIGVERGEYAHDHSAPWATTAESALDRIAHPGKIKADVAAVVLREAIRRLDYASADLRMCAAQFTRIVEHADLRADFAEKLRRFNKAHDKPEVEHRSPEAPDPSEDY